MKNTVAVVIPVYNRAEGVRNAVDSVLAQTRAPQEVIVVDDGSTDDTFQVLSSYGQKIKALRQRNQGVSAARNRGVAAAQSEWIAFLDADDIWHKDKLEKQIAFIRENPTVQIVQTDEVWIRRGRRVNPMKKHQKHDGNIFEHCLPLCCVTVCSVIMKKELFEKVGGFDEELPACEDYDLWLRIAKDTPIYLMREKLLTHYVGHAGQLSNKYWGMDRFRVYALEKLIRKGLSTEQKRSVKRELYKKCSILANGAWKRRKYGRWMYYTVKKSKYQKYKG